MLFQRFRHSIKIDHIIPKAIDVLGSIRTECAQRVHIDGTAFLQQPLQCPGHRYQRVERQEVRNKMVVLDKLTLLITDVLGNDSLATEAHPLNELVERLTFVGSGLNHLAQFETGYVLQQENGTRHPA